jgi:Protein of unknown function (DUF2281)
MNRKVLIENTIKKIEQLPDIKIKEVEDFAEFLLSKVDDKILVEGIQKLGSDSKAFEFLKDEEDIYTVNDVKEKYVKNSFNK